MITPIILNGGTNSEKVKTLMNKLETGIVDIFNSENYADYLKAMSKFTNYSFNNTILIILQGGTLVAGYNKWKKDFNRQVKKGAKGIKIFAPCFSKKKDEDDDEEKEVHFYKVATVFDVSQTEGDEIPHIQANELTDSVESYQLFMDAISKVSPVPIGFEEIGDSCHGYYHTDEKRIAIQSGMSEAQTLKTLVHEITHSILHDTSKFEKYDVFPDSRTREVQAESVAYIVCNYFGIDTSDYSFGYIAAWSSGKEVKELTASMKIIQDTSVDLIKKINSNLI